MNMNPLVFWANPFGDTGYAIHSRNILLAMKKLGYDVFLDSMSLINDDILKLCTPDMLEVIERSMKNPPKEIPNEVMINTPEMWRMKYVEPRRKLLGCGVFEGDRAPAQWVREANHPKLTKLLVPSEHTKNAFVNAGVTKDIAIIPHGIDETVFRPDAQKPTELADDNFTFLFVGGWRDNVNDRKGLEVALRAFCAEFKHNEKVRFAIKINFAYSKPNQNYVAELASLNLPPEKEHAPLILFSTQNQHSHLANMYASADCFVMPSKAEAFCMPCLEAAACGTPVIANAYGGQADYLSKKPSSCFLVEPTGMATATGGWLYEDTKWSIPSQKGFQEMMRYVFDNSTATKKKAVKNADYFRQSWNWMEAAKKLQAVLTE